MLLIRVLLINYTACIVVWFSCVTGQNGRPQIRSSPSFLSFGSVGPSALNISAMSRMGEKLTDGSSEQTMDSCGGGDGGGGGGQCIIPFPFVAHVCTVSLLKGQTFKDFQKFGENISYIMCGPF